MKACSSCEEEKSLVDFPPDGRRKDGRGSKCRICARAVQETFYAKYPDKEATRRLKNSVHGASWYQRNRASQLERMRWNGLMRKYGINQEYYEYLLTYQNNRCAICQTTDPGRQNWNFAVEHDHDTGNVRGLTCHQCNVGLGMFKDSPVLLRAAASYLERSL